MQNLSCKYKKFLNRYAIVAWILYLITPFVMNYQTPRLSIEGYVGTLPLIFICTLFSIFSKHAGSTAIEELRRDLFLISYGFLIGAYIYVLTQFDNTDMRGWWVLNIYYISAVGITFSLFFAYTVNFLKSHEKYTDLFGILVIGVLSLSSILPTYIKLPCFPVMGVFECFVFMLCILHLLMILIFKLKDLCKRTR